MAEQQFFSRDISWLSFNQRVLTEAAQATVPLAERLNFLSIYSSNLDEFYRVRMPVLMAKEQFSATHPHDTLHLRQASSGFAKARQIINIQQNRFGQILTTQLLPLLAEQNVLFLYNRPIPEVLAGFVRNYFFAAVAAFLQPVFIRPETSFFPENSRLYFLVSLHSKEGEQLVIVNIPSDNLPRFLSVNHDGKQYVLMIDDIVKYNLPYLFTNATITGCYSFKITRDAGLDLEDELPENVAEKIEKVIARRDKGRATRLLHQPLMPLRQLQLLCQLCKTKLSYATEGGIYHNLKDIAALPLARLHLTYPKQPALPPLEIQPPDFLFDVISKRDIIIHPPYNSYEVVLRFFSEAAIDRHVEEIYVTLYRIAADSKIAHALISAAKNGKKVLVFVELKARFDEANNIRWAKKLKEAGVSVIYSIPKLKVHAKIALVKRKINKSITAVGLLATGNLNESTARFYTDHVLLTAHRKMLREMELLFLFLTGRKKPGSEDYLPFNHLLVAQFNLQQKFLQLIDREIINAKQGLPAGIIIKLNNLEEQVLISKLYEASGAGVKIQLIVRSICCLIPGIDGMSQNISIKRIVGRYLEHGRIFIFCNGGRPEVFMGSADWMNRNIYTRIEVCFPIYDEAIKAEMIKIIELQLQDNIQAVWINKNMDNMPVEKEADQAAINSQEAIYEMLQNKLSAGTAP